MAENTIDTLSLEINSNAGRAVDSLDRLAGSILTARVWHQHIVTSTKTHTHTHTHN